MLKAELKRRNLWKDILERTGSKKEFGLLALPDWDCVKCCRLEKDWLSNVFGERDMYGVKPWNPLFIVSQTGTGKSTLVLEKCLPVAMKEEKKILYCANRVVLVSHMKERAMKNKLNGELEGDIGLIKDMKKYYSDEGIQDCYNFGGVDIYSYHELLHHMYELDFSMYSFVIFDETHFFISDATFNPYTEEILDRLLEKARNNCRIYLTATPEESIFPIYSKERAYLKNEAYGFGEMMVYIMDEDYSYINPIFFDDEEVMINKIIESKNDSWLVFVREKVSGERIRDEVSKAKEDAVFITADSDRDSAEYRELIEKGKLPKRVLITTKVLDVGIDIFTKNLNIVLFEDNIVEMKQMIGRKRIKKNEKINVFFFVPTYKELSKRWGRIKEEISNEKALMSAIESSEKSIYYEVLPHPLYCGSLEGVKYNRFSVNKLEEDSDYYEDLLNKLKDVQESGKYASVYQELILQNFKGVNTSGYLEGDADEETKKAVLNLIKKWEGSTIIKEEFPKFAAELAAIAGDARKDRREGRGEMGKAKVNEVLEQYGYFVDTVSVNPAKYQLKKIGRKLKNG
ncbi:MAG: DEAD/DEAH box helicase family protein [Clostridiales bacterium]|nr:DEAD/DEAH box helicase family protein [Clostridiales bacterium]